MIQSRFKIVGYGCTKCIENSTNIPDKTVLDAIEKVARRFKKLIDSLRSLIMFYVF